MLETAVWSFTGMPLMVSSLFTSRLCMCPVDHDQHG